jgi:hypothetical protein
MDRLAVMGSLRCAWETDRRDKETQPLFKALDDAS